jgi:hypothetical protein
MNNLKNRVDRLEAAPPDDIAGWLGGLAVVVPLPDGRFQLPDKREVTQGELDTLLHGARGRLLILRIRPQANHTSPCQSNHWRVPTSHKMPCRASAAPAL